MKRIMVLMIVFLIVLVLFNTTALSKINNGKDIRETLENPTWEWAESGGGISIDYGNDVVVDEDGNTYIIGKFDTEATFGTITLKSHGTIKNWDIFVAKLDNTGNWLWAVNAGGTFQDEGNGIALDDDGNIYITGLFYDTAYFGNITLTSFGELDVYIAKLDNNGNWLWAIRAGGAAGEEAYGIAVDDNGNIYVTGHFMFLATFGPFPLNSQGSADVFVVKLDTDGNWLWAQRGGGNSPDFVCDIALDNNGNIFLTGDFERTATFGMDNITSLGNVDVFIAKLDNDGNWLWARSGGSTSIERGYDIEVDINGNVYVTGVFLVSITFGTTTLTSQGEWDVYVLKLDTNGDFLWVVRGGSSSGDGAWGIALDNSGNPYITGVFSDFTTFGTTTLTSQGFRDVFVAKLDTDGNWQWAISAGGTGFDEGYSIILDTSGYIYVTGYYNSSATFGTISLTGKGDFDVFIAKLSHEGVNSPPNVPKINGPNNGKTGTSYEYIFTSTDPESDDIAEYIINWGDEQDEIITGPFTSGSPAIKNHTWSKKGTYIIQAKAKDIWGAESDWATIEVSIPRNKDLHNSLLLKLIDGFPFIYQIIRYIFGLLDP